MTSHSHCPIFIVGPSVLLPTFFLFSFFLSFLFSLLFLFSIFLLRPSLSHSHFSLLLPPYLSASWCLIHGSFYFHSVEQEKWWRRFFRRKKVSVNDWLQVRLPHWYSPSTPQNIYIGKNLEEQKRRKEVWITFEKEKNGEKMSKSSHEWLIASFHLLPPYWKGKRTTGSWIAWFHFRSASSQSSPRVRFSWGTFSCNTSASSRICRTNRNFYFFTFRGFLPIPYFW